MIQEQKTEPPSCPRIPLFMVGQDSHGNWVVQDQSRTRGGLFVDRIDALRFVRSENANRTQAYIAVSEVFEFNIARATSALQRQPVLNTHAIRGSLDLSSFKSQPMKNMLGGVVLVANYPRFAPPHPQALHSLHSHPWAWTQHAAPQKCQWSPQHRHHRPPP